MRYHYIDLGTLGGRESWGTGINNWGQVVGVSETENGESRGFLWMGKKMKALESLDDDITSGAWSINDRGQVVGFSLGADEQRQAILWDREGVHEPETLGGTSNNAFGINRHGEIVGWSLTSENLFHAALWDSDGVTDLDPPQSVYSYATSINKRGDAVGGFLTSDERVHAVLWDGKGVRELGTLGGMESEAFWINDKGDAVGWCDLPGSLGWHACLWNRHGDVIDLGAAEGLNSEAFSINDYGQVVGLYYPGASLVETRACVWTKKHGMLDLNTLADLPDGVVLELAISINDFGWITGMSNLGRAYVLIPYRSDKEMRPHKDSFRPPRWLNN
jgi:probable HAF family extracellular repeat protein